ncbi:LLM class flavin-dependent oxidoreductase [Umezawaea endophytica]|uniref:LLM class flavin-dependent oxidoreductase n=1 Tax=Umezawaea endophytica TaxID=1654476 RepID=A0A9X2VG77_9PSEU|nr:LLM class flavin-dependent oxidoreductase [Umezawaea endophytica]MCS7475554.1 LLM class flavin-dependent oxidoreductase [Umezawaea endophytica]
MGERLEVIGTATVPWLPPSHDFRPHLAALARRAERHGFTGLLVFYDHLVLDPWVVAGLLLQETSTLVPLVAVQPYAVPPFTAAKTIAGLTSLYRRRVDLNIITGAAPEELDQIGDPLDHDGRYARAAEYATLLRRLLGSDEPLTWNGEHYRFRALRINTELPRHLLPRVFVPGSSEASRRLGDQVGHVTITHPEPVDLFAASFAASHRDSVLEMGIRVGLVARPTAEEAWAAALDGHRVDRAARLRTLLKRESESDWNRRLARLASEADVHDDVYWTGLYSTGRTGAPVLVGGYEQVAGYLDRYRALGVSKLLLTKVDTEDDFRHAGAVLSLLDR